MTTMLAPILAFCVVGALAVAVTIVIAALFARRHNRRTIAPGAAPVDGRPGDVDPSDPARR